jgi:hypothetical protein
MRCPLALALILAAGFANAAAGEVQLLPRDISLTGPGARQQLLVIRNVGGFLTDRTDRAAFESSNPAVARIEGSRVIAVNDGEATLTARVGDEQSTAKVVVAKAKAETAPSFRNDVIPILTRMGCNSGGCHGALAGKGGLKLSLRGYDPESDHFNLTRQAGGRRIDLLEPGKSLILLKPTTTLDHGGGLKFEVDSAEYRTLAEWIAHGAPGPQGNEAAVQRLEVLPPLATMKPENELRVLVRAHYSDATVRDVTPWAKFSSSEDLVASVSESGLASVKGHGEAAITVWYSNHVAAMRIVSPFANRVDAETFARAPRLNYIDDLVLRKLEALRIPPSPSCSDEEFVRRAYLDAAGILPTPDETRRFLSDRAPDKRSKLIDALLQRPEFVDHWAYKWSDLLLVSTRKLPQPAVWAFYQHIRQSVADNKAWDQFAREVLTARGSNLANGAGNWFVLHKDVSELTEATSVVFMGMSITCARCHNHPLEKWTQDQYWGMANLFSRVAIKNGDRPGELTVQDQPFGDAPHLRRGVPMPPTPLDGKPLPLDSPANRRAYFADWLTSADNPYFAKALVNRVWRNFMGRGLVEAEDDLRQTNPASNEELLNTLAADFVKNGYDVKGLIRTIMNSAAYQRSSKPLAGNEEDDRFYSRYLVRRLKAEVALDAYSQITGVPTPFEQLRIGASGGFAKTNNYPLGMRALQLPDNLVVSRFLDAFGRPERQQTCSCERTDNSSVGLALHLNNGQTLNDKLRAKNSIVEAWLKENISDEEAVRRVYELALCRMPNAVERHKLLRLMAEAAADKSPRREILEDLLWSVLTSKEFLFNR